MRKRGQITVFVIVGIFVLIAALGIFYLIYEKNRTKLDKEFFAQQHIKPDINLIQSSIIGCMSETSRSSLDVIGVQGGFYKKPEKYYDLVMFFIPYYYFNGEFLIPSKARVEEELADYVADNLDKCLNKLSFENYDLKFSNPEVEASITNTDTAVFNIDAPVTVEREGKSIILETIDHEIVYDSYLYRILEVADYITNSHTEDEDMMCVSCIAEMSYKRDLYVDFLEFNGNQETLVIITENKTSPEPYIFEFLNKYPPLEV
ncbi:hypothetical protein GF386_05875 [Candidatus Pacearchaeota archaeon]|nr:hypothetical protein [Candidatus Pacearchaeota archaeon]MBD3283621.1 hypothetical protein [Candidatus Pacearchaeota archaeon]